MREDPNVEFGRLDQEQYFGFGEDPSEQEMMQRKLQNIIDGVDLFDEQTEATVIDNVMMPPPGAPNRKNQESHVQSTPINQEGENIDINSADVSRVQPFKDILNPRRLSELEGDSSDLTELRNEENPIPPPVPK